MGDIQPVTRKRKPRDGEVTRQADGTYRVKVAHYGAISKVPTYSLARRIRKVVSQAWEDGASNPYA